MRATGMRTTTGTLIHSRPGFHALGGTTCLDSSGPQGMHHRSWWVRCRAPYRSPLRRLELCPDPRETALSRVSGPGGHVTAAPGVAQRAGRPCFLRVSLLKPLLQIRDPPLRRLAYVARLADPPRSVVERGCGIPGDHFRLAQVPIRRVDRASPIYGFLLAPPRIRGLLRTPPPGRRPILALLRFRRHVLHVRCWCMIA